MRIAFLCWEFPPHIVGGLGTYAQYVTCALTRRGHDLSVFAPGAGAAPTRDEWKGIAVHRPRPLDLAPIFPYVVTDELRSWGSLSKELLRFNLWAAEAALTTAPSFDLIAVHDWLSAPAGLLLAAQQPAPVVFHIHSTERGRQPGGGSPAVHHWEGALAHHAEAIITVSEAMRSDLAKHGWDSAKLSAIWNGVDPAVYGPEVVSPKVSRAMRDTYRIGLDKALILYVGRLTAVKGVGQLVEAMPAVLPQHPEARLVLLGRGELAEQLRERVNALGLAEAVTIRDEFVSEDERIAHYAACNLAVFPSTYEPFGIVGLEAMAMAKPVVVGASGVVGLREQVINSGAGQTGLHVNGTDPTDIAWGLNTALDRRDEWSTWGHHGRQRVLDRFTWDHAAAKTEAVYRRVVGEG
ncbi:MAG: glycosyl transferase family 1 [Dehalococcoidia bacterium]|nr:glycosyl transferase family 1 [Dehalococcoidia bacterium]